MDPTLGRLILPEEFHPTQVQVSYSYGFSDDVGGGPYFRRHTLSVPDPKTWVAYVSRTPRPQSNDLRCFKTLHEALQAWSQADETGVIRIADNSTYDLSSPEDPQESAGGYAIELDGRRGLAIEAVENKCPCLIIGELQVTASDPGASLTLNGLFLDGKINVQGPLKLNIVHCTLRPLRRPVSAETENSIQATEREALGLQVSIEHSIVGTIRLPQQSAGLQIHDSIVDGVSGIAISGAPDSSSEDSFGPPTSLHRSTVLGEVRVAELTTSDVIFTHRISVQRQRIGFVRYCYVSDESRTPRRYHCQPDMALVDMTDPALEQQTRARLKPLFTSLVLGQPGYAQLSLRCPVEIRTGAEDGSEMGTFHNLHQPQRQSRLRAALDEYLPIGLQASIYFSV